MQCGTHTLHAVAATPSHTKVVPSHPTKVHEPGYTRLGPVRDCMDFDTLVGLPG